MPDLVDVRPALQAVCLAGPALGLGPRELLHAGPPLTDPRRPPQTLVSSVIMTCLHEGWAPDEDAALAMLHDGTVTLSPAQPRRCVTPLAAVVGPGTPLLEVGDLASDLPCVYAPVSAVRGTDTRMGTRDPGLIARLAHRDRYTAPALSHWLHAAGPLPLWPLAAAGLAAGDDLHGSTQHANEALAAALRAGHADPALADDVAATPLFFLTLWMAACALMLRAADHGPVPSLVTRAGGNGERFGIALAGRPDRWLTCAAGPPQGPRLPGVADHVAIEGAIGDSAVIDLLGLGGQRLGRAPSLAQLLRGHIDLPPDAGEDPVRRLLTWPHPLLDDRWPLGLDARRVAALRMAPRVMLAMLGRDGRTGLCGRGVLLPPVALFETARDG
jgi:hypothetical protein